MALRIYNTLTGQKSDFVPLEPGKVRMYVCGITSYAPSHIGHARVAVAFDVVYRWLKKNFLVTFVRNYTDIDDKIIKAANKANEDPGQLSERFIAQYDADTKELGCMTPDVEPRVTKHIPEVIDLIKRIEEKGHAYEIDGDVYFDVPSYEDYGRLSKRSLEDLEAGARVEVDQRKRSPYDFALWKSAKPGEPSWDSPWGKGRPGWHIECSAMSEKYLGPTFDIHGGGKDLVFPHHENEMAQSCSVNGAGTFAQVWMHNGFLNLLPAKCPKCDEELTKESTVEAGSVHDCGYVFTEEDLKMAKSRGNFYPIREVLARYEREALRLLFLNSHYRKPIQFSHDLLADTERRLDKNYETLERITGFTKEQTFIPGKSFAGTFGFDPREKVAEALDDDFNTAKAVAELAEVFHIANDLTRGMEKERIGKMLSPEDTSRLLYEVQEIIAECGGFLGLWQEDPKAYIGRRKMARTTSLELTPAQIEDLIKERAEARIGKDFKRSDEIRDELRAKGIVLRDTKEGTSWDVEES